MSKLTERRGQPALGQREIGVEAYRAFRRLDCRLVFSQEVKIYR
jgi:hypothetical protein